MSESSKLSSNTENKDYNTLSPDQKAKKDVQQVKGIYFLFNVQKNRLIILIKTNCFKQQCSSSSFLLAWSRYTGPKLPLSAEQASPMSKIHSTSLLVLHGHFGLVYYLRQVKMMMKKCCFLE